MGNVNRKAYASEKQHTQQVIAEAFPHLIAVFGGHGGGRTPRDHTISFHLRDAEGRLRSNVMWVLPEFLNRLTVKDVRAMVARANGRWDSKRRRARSKAAPRSI